MRKHPWFKFYASRWLGDPHLRLVGAMARGVLIDLMAIAHDGDPYGYVTNGGIPLSDDDIASYCKERVDYTRAKLDLLRSNGRLATDSKGVYYIPSMVRQAEQHEKHVRDGLKGGNPDLVKGVNPEDKPGVKAEQREKESKSKNKNKTGGYSSDFEKLWKAYPIKKEKAKAFEEFEKYNPTPLEVSSWIEKIEAYIKHKDEKDGYHEFCAELPYLRRYIKNRRWEDELESGAV